MANYLIYPFKNMRITQSYNGTTSHLPHMTGKPSEYAIDEGGADSGRDYMYCPCDEMKIVKIYGVGNKGTNTIWLTSTSEVDTPSGKGYVTLLATHPNDDDLKKLKVGQKFKRKEAMFREGADGATGNHIHMAIGFGQMSGNGWTQNTKSKWVLTTTGKQLKPEEAFYVDGQFTRIVNNRNLPFKGLPTKPLAQTTQKATTATKPKYTTGNYKVTSADVLNVRTGPSTSYSAKTFSQLSASAQSKILKLTGKKKINGYVKGLTFTVTEVNGSFGKTGSGWVSLDYCTKI